MTHHRPRSLPLLLLVALSSCADTAQLEAELAAQDERLGDAEARIAATNEKLAAVEKRLDAAGAIAQPPTVDHPPAVAETCAVILEGWGEAKISVIKVVRELTGLGLREAKDVVEAAPSLIKDGLLRAEADAAKAKLDAAGAKVGLRCR